MMDEMLRRLRQVDGRVTDEILSDIIEEHQPRREKMIRLYERYKGEAPIYSRTMPDYEAVNNRLGNDFFGEIIDTKVGYFLGKPIIYQTEDRKLEEAVRDFGRRNSIEDLDAETGKYAAICGYGARLLYVDENGEERAMNIPPWEAVFIMDRSTDEIQYAMRYYTVKVVRGGVEYERTRVEWYDRDNVTFYIQNGQGGFDLDDTEPVNPLPHMFGYVPMVEFPNNEERQGDAEKVLSLIDDYDRTTSDVANELEAFRLAYMAFYGFEPDETTLEEAKQTGAFGIPADAEGKATGKIEYITKDLNDTIIQNHLDRLEQNILRFAKSVNFGDEQFAGNLSGVAMKYKMFALESKCITAERKFSASLQRQFKILASAWEAKGDSVDPSKLTFQFNRNLPVDIEGAANTSATLKGLVSEETRLSLLPFIDDPKEEMDRMAQEAIDLEAGVEIGEQGAGDVPGSGVERDPEPSRTGVGE